jgi:hypothetical protein
VLAVDVVPGLTAAQVDAFGSVLGAAGTVAAIALTLVALFREVRTRRTDEERRLAILHDEESRHARLVFGEMAHGGQHGTTTHDGNVVVHQTEVLGSVDNSGGSPILDVWVSAPECDPVRRSKIRAGDRERVVLGHRPGDYWERNPDATMTVQFTDSEGRRWRREGMGTPVRCLEAEA